MNTQNDHAHVKTKILNKNEVGAERTLASNDQRAIKKRGLAHN